jgi:hypothetical protein
MRRCALLLSAIAFATPARANEPDVYAAIVNVQPRDGQYDGYYCPPDDGESICLGDSILIQRSSIVRFIGKRPSRDDPRFIAASGFDVDGPFVRVRMIGGHARRRIPSGQYIAILELTDKNYLFAQWYDLKSVAKGCFPSGLMAHYGARLNYSSMKPKKDGRMCI